MNMISYENEEMAEAYTKLGFGIWKSEAETIARYCRASDAILDVGCGAGRIAIGLHKLGYDKVYATDMSENMINVAKQISQASREIHFIHSDIVKECIFPECSFRVVIFGYNGFMCIPGIGNRKKALKNIASMLQPDGVFIFTVQEQVSMPENKWYGFWEKRKNDFIAQGKSITDDAFGDLVVEDKGRYVFHHFVARDEIKKMLEAKWTILDTFWRDDKYTEEESVLTGTNNCRFYICRKKYIFEIMG